MPDYIFPVKGTKTTEKISVIIPAAGMGNRVKKLGPKPLIQLDDKTVFQHQYTKLKANIPNCEIILVVGYMADKVMSAIPSDVIKVENEKYEDTNVVRSIGMGLRAATTNKVLIVYGDLVFNNHSIAGLHLDKQSILAADSSGYMKEEEIGCTVINNIVEHTFYDLPNKWMQILYLTGQDLELFKSICWNRSNARMYGYEAINLAINEGLKLKCVFPAGGEIVDIDYSEDVIRALEIVRR
jgi:choline kinase